MHSTLGNVLIFYAIALTLLITPAMAVDSQASDGVEQQHRRPHDELTFTQIDAPGAVATAALGINDRGQIVGIFLDAGGMIHRFLLDDGAFSQIDIPGEAPLIGVENREGIRINDRGQIVTSFHDTGAPPLPGVQTVHGVLVEGGTFTQIDVPGAIATETLAVNDRGQSVGDYVDAGGTLHGFVAHRKKGAR